MVTTINSGDTETYESGTTTYGGGPLNVGGQLNVGGELNLTDSYAAAVALASGATQTTTGERVNFGVVGFEAGSDATITGERVRFGVSTLQAGAESDFRRTIIYSQLRVSGGATLTTTPEVVRTESVMLSAGGDLTVDGAKFRATSSVTLAGAAAVSARGTRVKTTGATELVAGAGLSARETRIRFANATLSAGARFTADGDVIIPLVRSDDIGLDFDTDEDFDLSTNGP